MVERDILPELKRIAPFYLEAKMALDDFSVQSDLGIGISNRDGVAMLYALSKLFSREQAEAHVAVQGLDENGIARIVSDRIIEYLSSTEQEAVPEVPTTTSLDEERVARLVADKLRPYFANLISVPVDKPHVTGRVPYVTVYDDFLFQFDPDAEDEPEGRNRESSEELDPFSRVGYVKGIDEDEEEEESDEEYDRRRASYLNRKISKVLQTFCEDGWQVRPEYSVVNQDRQYDPGKGILITPEDLRTEADKDLDHLGAVVVLQRGDEWLRLGIDLEDQAEEAKVYYTLHVPNFVQGVHDIRTDFIPRAKAELVKQMNRLEKAFGELEDNEHTEDGIEFCEAADWIRVFDG